jgi:hypothetical protein
MTCGPERVYENYLTICWWGWVPYPCIKTRLVTRYCYDFTWVRGHEWGLWGWYEGCCGGRKYSWSSFVFNVWGSKTWYNIRKCFSSEPSSSGECEGYGYYYTEAPLKIAKWMPRHRVIGERPADLPAGLPDEDSKQHMH